MVELSAALLESGMPVTSAPGLLAAAEREAGPGPSAQVLDRVDTALRLGLLWDRAWQAAGTDLPGALADYRDALGFAARSGAPSAQLLRSQAAAVRRRAYREAEKAAEQLGVRLVVPLGLCSLPAFVCWGVLPVLMGLLPEVFG